MHGIGKYKSKTNGKNTIEFQTWINLLRRIYKTNIKSKFNSYENVTICKEWLNFQVFAEWFDKNYPKHIKDIKFNLDKDLLQQGIKNKIYSPETCIFLPQKINFFLPNYYKTNTSGYTGVSWNKYSNKWTSNINDFNTNKNKFLGNFDNIINAKDSYIKARTEQCEKAKEYMRILNIYTEDIIQLVK